MNAKLLKTLRSLGVSKYKDQAVEVEFFENHAKPQRKASNKAEDLPKVPQEEIIEREMERLLVEDPLAHEQLLQRALLQ